MGQEKRPKTASGERDILLLPPALGALKAQHLYTRLKGNCVFNNLRTEKPLANDEQIRLQF